MNIPLPIFFLSLIIVWQSSFTIKFNPLRVFIRALYHTFQTKLQIDKQHVTQRPIKSSRLNSSQSTIKYTHIYNSHQSNCKRNKSIQKRIIASLREFCSPHTYTSNVSIKRHNSQIRPSLTLSLSLPASSLSNIGGPITLKDAMYARAFSFNQRRAIELCVHQTDHRTLFAVGMKLINKFLKRRLYIPASFPLSLSLGKRCIYRVARRSID